MKSSQSLGIVDTKYFTFAQPPEELVLSCKKSLGPITIAYETYGTFNTNKSNAILICHGLSGDAHAAGYHSDTDTQPGWWDNMIGPSKPFDTNQYFIISSNVLGGCKGSTGPASIDPKTGKPYGMRFPVITIQDMVQCQKQLIDHLGIKKLLCVVGGSMGGMQALQWTVSYPDMVASAIPIACTAVFSAQNIAFHEVGRQAIISDPNWNQGDYYHGERPAKGLAVARMLGHITYLSEETMETKFGRNLQNHLDYQYGFHSEFKVESYLHYQGDSFNKRFDANSYLYITKAMDYFDLRNGNGSLSDSFRNIQSRFLVISFSSDWLFPASQSKLIVKHLRMNHIPVSYCELTSVNGHDAFLIQNEQFSNLISGFLSSVADEIHSTCSMEHQYAI